MSNCILEVMGHFSHLILTKTIYPVVVLTFRKTVLVERNLAVAKNNLLLLLPINIEFLI